MNGDRSFSGKHRVHIDVELQCCAPYVINLHNSLMLFQ